MKKRRKDKNTLYNTNKDQKSHTEKNSRKITQNRNTLMTSCHKKVR